MSDKELHLLEQKVESLLMYCEQIRSERNGLLKKTEEQASRLNQLEEKITMFEEERENVRICVSDLIGKIEKVEVLSEHAESPVILPQAEEYPSIQTSNL